MNTPPRTYLFVPGNRPERFAKALSSGADAVVLDLEDAVAGKDRPAAREAVVRFIAAADDAHRGRLVVRVNEARSGDFGQDAAALASLASPVTVMLAKAESPQQVAALATALPGAPVLALIESACGVASVEAIAAAPGVGRLVYGTLDYALDLALDITDDPIGLAYAASRIVLASRLAGLPPPVAGVTQQLDDEAQLLRDLAWSRQLGFGAKLCIHPRQVAPLHAALQPSAEALGWARRVLAAEAASPGAAQLDGRMIDRPVMLQAERTLQRARS